MQGVNKIWGLEYLSTQLIYYFVPLQNYCRIMTLWKHWLHTQPLKGLYS